MSRQRSGQKETCVLLRQMSVRGGGGAVVNAGTSWQGWISAMAFPCWLCIFCLCLYGLSPGTLIPPAVQKHAHYGDKLRAKLRSLSIKLPSKWKILCRTIVNAAFSYDWFVVSSWCVLTSETQLLLLVCIVQLHVDRPCVTLSKVKCWCGIYEQRMEDGRVADKPSKQVMEHLSDIFTSNPIQILLLMYSQVSKHGRLRDTLSPGSDFILKIFVYYIYI